MQYEAQDQEFFQALGYFNSKQISIIYASHLENPERIVKKPKLWWTKKYDILFSTMDFRLKLIFCHSFLDYQLTRALEVTKKQFAHIPSKKLKEMVLTSRSRLFCLNKMIDIDEATDIFILNKLRNKAAHELVDDILELDFTRFLHYDKNAIETKFKAKRTKRQAKEVFLAMKLLHISDIYPRAP
jgi:hypothetical protein